jgi:Protein of unknown function (DUF3172)
MGRRTIENGAILSIVYVSLCSVVVAFCPGKAAYLYGSPSLSVRSGPPPTRRFGRKQQWKHILAARRRRDSDRFYGQDEADDEYYNDDDDGGFDRRRRRNRSGPVDDLGSFEERSGLDLPSSYGRRDGWRLPESVSKSLLAGVFVLGVGLGVTVDSQVNTNPKDLASRDAIDNAAPNPTLCAKLGASAMAFDQRVFVSFNPFNVYVSQADVKPACVLREANVVPVLKARGLINDSEVRSCKQNMNTWAFVGSLDDSPQLSCGTFSRRCVSTLCGP